MNKIRLMLLVEKFCHFVKFNNDLRLTESFKTIPMKEQVYRLWGQYNLQHIVRYLTVNYVILF